MMYDTMVQPLSAGQKRLSAEDGPSGPGDPPLELGALLSEFYSDLKRLARKQTRRFPWWRSLRTTGLVHEAFERLLRRDRRAWTTRRHFFADVNQAMEDIAVEYVRRKQAKKRGGDQVRTDRVSDLMDGDGGRAAAGERAAVFRALERLRAEHSKVAEIVFLRFYCDMTMEEIAGLLGVATRTVERKWEFARRWLETELGL